MNIRKEYTTETNKEPFTTENICLEMPTIDYVEYLEERIKQLLIQRVSNVCYDEEDFDLQDCPNCNSEAVGYDGTGSVPFLECFQCDHNWIP
jgi:hypothetical protein